MFSIDGVTIDVQGMNRIMNTYGFLGGVVAKIHNGSPGSKWERRISVFASCGLTQRIQMIGLNVGYSL